MKTAEITEIEVPFPEIGEPHLYLALGACHTRLMPGSLEVWTLGTYRDPSGALPCRVIQDGSTLRITQNQNPSEFFGLFSGVPHLELELGKRQPYTLSVESGASENSYDFGGLPITQLDIRQGASAVAIDFSEPNPQSMSRFRLEAGAGRLQLHNLANANFGEMTVEGGAAAYELDFGGVLRRDAAVVITTGMASVEIRLPRQTAAKVVSKLTMGGVTTDGGFTLRDAAFWTPAALAGGGPLLTIQASIALGSLHLLTW
jgi:hypothetical protein